MLVLLVAVTLARNLPHAMRNDVSVRCKRAGIMSVLVKIENNILAEKIKDTSCKKENLINS